MATMRTFEFISDNFSLDRICKYIIISRHKEVQDDDDDDDSGGNYSDNSNVYNIYCSCIRHVVITCRILKHTKLGWLLMTYEGVFRSFRTESITKCTLTTRNTR
jgi:hypothetical protein